MQEKKIAAQVDKVHPRIVAAKKRETGIGRRLMDEVKASHAGNAYQQIGTFFDNFDLPAGTGRTRNASFRTKKNYVDRLTVVVRTLGELNMSVQNLDEISAKQIRRAFDFFEKEGRPAGWLANTNTTVRRFGIWIGKPDLCPALPTLLENPANAVRQYTAIHAKDWATHCDDVESVISKVEGYCSVTGLQLRLAQAFGVRITEFLMFRPEKALTIEGQLSVLEGTKGGRPRNVPIETEAQRELIERVRLVAAGNAKGILSAKPGQSLASARSHAYYVMRKAGITKKALGFTVHGLRHQYACTIYKQLTGEEAPVRGGGLVDEDLDKKSRLDIAERLGHSRPEIVSAYIGSHRTLTNLKRRNLQKLHESMEADQQLVELAKRGGIKGVYVIGPAAEGAPLKPTDVMCIGYTAAMQDGKTQWESDAYAASHAMEMSQRAGTLLGRPVSFMPMSLLGHKLTTFELYLTGEHSISIDSIPCR
ncbi:MAG: integrase domain-containing protein [Pseudomonadota bacterium]